MPEQLKLEITLDEANMILSALGNLPYIQVHRLIHQLQNQLGPQLLELDAGSDAPVNTNGKLNKTTAA
ncbi:hypothetical protein [Chitinophaga solisilvae]|uniref:Uncharacterized protein n=1 Tax=Chitinophaga solisilvae TaxID=1233460 RepID=A0A3S1DRZ4_9BACT|nr:hypothetical protein [Chitinophaga solisilvae]NSL86359.1 hypothetical protein [Chitinophaga solisilvae]